MQTLQREHRALEQVVKRGENIFQVASGDSKCA